MFSSQSAQLSTAASSQSSEVQPGVYPFDHNHDLSGDELVSYLGGKGAGLAEMSQALGLNVPPGFTISVPMCLDYFDHGWPAALDERIAHLTHKLGKRMGRHLGNREDPLLLAVRSGAPISMPGMMDTVLNLGLNDDTVLGLASSSGSEEFAWDSYHRFLKMFAVTVMGIDSAFLGKTVRGTSATDNSPEGVTALKEAIAELTGREVPSDPVVQLREAIEAVFRSWNSSRAQTYRARENIDAGLGTGVTIQAMVFGNRGENSGTGVVFTRDPSTGENQLFGDYLPRAQGEDVVAGTARTMPVSALESLHPEVYVELKSTLRKLEVHYRDMCDVEFTVEEGKLWLLQTRIGKRGASAAVRIAMNMAMDPEILLMPNEVIARVPSRLRDRARTEALAHVLDEVNGPTVITKGLGASPGRATGRVVLTSDEAADADDDVILVRHETSPEDVAGMSASVGLLTTNGGLVSHAAVVARGWGIPAVVGAHELILDSNGITTPEGQRIKAGEVLTIDGTTGGVWLGDVTPPSADVVVKAIEHELPELLVLERWAVARDMEGIL
ncbi:PEP/pyruvate-binding domain-containing protein [Citricoccus zhacaiensis]